MQVKRQLAIPGGLLTATNVTLDEHGGRARARQAFVGAERFSNRRVCMQGVNVSVSLGLGLLLVIGNLSMAAAQQEPMKANLVSENASGVTGSAMLTDLGGGKVRVAIEATGTGPDPRPAHIHEGRCANDNSMGMGTAMDPARPEYVLNTLVNGVSTTDLAIPMSDLLAVPHVINIHKSEDEIGFYIACADIASAQPQQVQLPLMQRPVIDNLVSENASGVTGSATLTDLGGGKVRIAIEATGTGPDPRPAHIHEGQCANDTGNTSMGMGMGTTTDPARPEYVLNTLVNGVSTTDLAIPMSDLLAVPHVINIHKSEDEIGFYIACADIASAQPQQVQLPLMQRPEIDNLVSENASGVTGSATLTDLG